RRHTRSKRDWSSDVCSSDLNEKEQMQQLLDAGYTTILSGGGPAEGNLTLKDHVEKGLIKGPRIIPSGTINLANNTPEKARAEVQIGRASCRERGENAVEADC